MTDGTAATDDDVADMLQLSDWKGARRAATSVLNNTSDPGLTLRDCDVVVVTDDSGGSGPNTMSCRMTVTFHDECWDALFL